MALRAKAKSVEMSRLLSSDLSLPRWDPKSTPLSWTLLLRNQAPARFFSTIFPYYPTVNLFLCSLYCLRFTHAFVVSILGHERKGPAHAHPTWHTVQDRDERMWWTFIGLNHMARRWWIGNMYASDSKLAGNRDRFGDI